MVALNVFFDGTNSTVSGLTTLARKLLPSTTGLVVASPTTRIARLTGWDKISPQGTTNAWAAQASLQPPTGEGFVLEGTALDNAVMAAGAWTGTIRLTFSHSTTATVVARIFKRSSAGVYTLIADARSASLGFSGNIATNVTVSTANAGGAAGVETPFDPGDTLYIGVNLNITTGSSNQQGTVALNEGVGANFSMATPGYSLVVARTSSDSAPAVDGADRQSAGAFNRTAGDPLATTADTTFTVRVLARSGVDTAGVSEQVASPRLVKRTAADTAPAADSLTYVQAIPKITVDLYENGVFRQTLISNARVSTNGIFDLPFDASVLSALAAGDHVELRVTSESVDIGAIEWVAKTDVFSLVSYYARTGSDTVTPADSAARSAVFVRSGADTASSSDAASRTAVPFRRSGADTTPATDATVRSVHRAHTGADSLASPGDAATRTGTFKRNLTDTAPATDDGTRRGDRFRTAADTVTPADVATRGGSRFFRTTSDAATATDSALRSFQFLRRTGSDTAPAVDQGVRSLTAPRTATDSASLTDSATRSAGIFRRTPSDALSLSDSVAHQALIRRTGTDAASLSDAATRAPIFRRTAADTASATDAATRFSARTRTASDAASASDAATRSPIFRRTASDIAPVRDTRTVIPNSSAEIDLTGIFANPSFEPARVTMSRVTDLVIPAGPTTGVRFSYAATVNSLGWGQLVKWFTEPVEGGRTYTLRYWARRVSGSLASISPQIYNDPATVNIWGGPGAQALTTSWASFSHTFTANQSSQANEHFLRFGVSVTQDAGEFEIAGVMLVPGAVSPTYPEPPGAVGLSVLSRAVSDIAGTPLGFPRTGGLVQRLVLPVFAERAGLPYVGDAANWVYLAGKDAVDTLAAPTDLATRVAVYQRTPADAASATDQGAGGRTYFRTATDTVTPTDAATRQSVFRRQGNETLAAPAESVTRNLVTSFFAADTTPATDAAVRTTILRRSAAEASATTDSTDRLITLARLARDNAGAVAPATGGLVKPVISPVFSTSGQALLTDSVSRSVLSIRTGADSASTADATTRSGTFRRALSDTVPTPTDAVLDAGFLLRSATDTAPVADSATRSFIGSRVVKEGAGFGEGGFGEGGFGGGLGIRDAVTILFRAVRSTDDLAPVADASTRLPLFRRAGSDTAPATDQGTQNAPRFRTGFDTVTPTDSASRAGSLYLRTAGDAAAVSDSLANWTLSKRSALDTVTPSDSASRSVVLPRTAADTTTQTDAASRKTVLPRTGADSFTTTDAATRLGTFKRALSDTAPTSSDFASGPGFLYRAASDTLVTTDAAVRSVGRFFRNLADTAPASDAPTSFAWIPRTASDTTVTSDAATRLGTFKRALPDTAAATDSASRQATFTRSATDTAPATDAAQGKGVRLRTATDSTPTATDAASRVLLARRTSSDTAPSTDDGARRGDRFRTASDTLTPSDAASRSGTFARTPSDALTTTDAAARITVYRRLGADSVGGTDAPTSSAYLPRLARDNAASLAPQPAGLVQRPVQPVFATSAHALVSDSVSRSILSVRSSTDSTSLIETVARQGTFKRAVPDSAPVVIDQVGAPGYLYRTVQDSAPAVDAVTRSQGIFRRTTPDSTTITDAASGKGIRSRTATDSTTTTDVATRTGTFARALSDTVTATDAAARKVSFVRTSSDTAPVTDAVTRSYRTTATGSDTVTPTDAATRAIVLRRSGADAASTSDSATRLTVQPRLGRDIAGAPSSIPYGLVQPVHNPLSPSQGVFVWDSARGTISAGRTTVDTAGATDAATRSISFERTASDSAPAADQISQAGSTILRWTRDEVSPTPSRPTGLVQPIIHPVAPFFFGTLDEVARWVANYRRLGDDSVFGNDSATRTVSYLRSASDSAGATDSVARKVTAPRTTVDTVTPADTVARSGVFKRALPDTATATDSASQNRGVYATGSDLAPALDTATRLGVWKRNPTDTTPATDDGTRRGDRFRAAADTVAAPTDAATRNQGIFRRTTSDTIGGSDAATRTQGRFYRTLTEVVPAPFDTPDAPGYRYRQAQDTVTPTDAATRSLGAFKRRSYDAQAQRLADPVARGTGEWGASNGTLYVNSDGQQGVLGNGTGDGARLSTARFSTLPSTPYSLSATVKNEGTTSQQIVVYNEHFSSAGGYLTSIAFGSRTLAPGETFTFEGVRTSHASSASANILLITQPVAPSGFKMATYGASVSLDVPPTDVAGQQVIWRRTTADAAPVGDAANRKVLGQRSGLEIFSTTDSASRTAFEFRATRDDAVFIAVHYRGLVQPVHHPVADWTSGSGRDRVDAYVIASRAVQDSAPATDAAARQPIIFLRSAGDALATSDSASRTLYLPRAVADEGNFTRGEYFGLVRPLVTPLRTEGYGLTDDTARYVVNYRRVGEDSVFGTDSATHLARHIRSFTETVAPTESLTHLTRLFRATQDDAQATDQPGGGRYFNRSATDAATATDSASRYVARSRTGSDSVSGLDSLTHLTRLYRATSDEGNYTKGQTFGLVRPLVTPLHTEGYGLTDDTARYVALVRRVGEDGVFGIDSVTHQVRHIRALTEVVTATDALTHQTRLYRSVADEGNYTRGQQFGLVRPLVTPLHTLGHGLVDDTVRWVMYYRRLTDDASTVSENLTHLLTHIRALSENTALSEALARKVWNYRFLADDAPADDAAPGQRFLKRSSGDSPGPVSDAATRTYPSLKRNPTDTAPATDDGTRRGDRFRSGSDSLTTTDMVARQAWYYRSRTDAATATDAVAHQTLLRRTASDSAPVTADIIDGGGFRYRYATDTVTPTDTATRNTVLRKTAADTAPVADLASRLTQYKRSATEALAVSDAATRKAFEFRSGSDTLTTTDAASTWRSLRRTGAEALTTTDAASIRYVLLRSSVDIAAVSDLASRMVTGLRSALDALGTTDFATPLRYLRHTAQDSLAQVTDTALVRRWLYRSTADTVTPTDSAQRPAIAYLRRASEALATTDLASRTLRTSRLSVDFSGVMAEGATRLVSLYRAGQDYAPANSEGSVLLSQFLRETLPPVLDAALARVLAVRRSTDLAPLTDAVARLVLARRSTGDLAPAADAVVRLRKAVRAALDVAAAADAATRVATSRRTCNDNAFVLDRAIRLKHAYRSAQDDLPVVTDVLGGSALAIRATFEHLLVTDEVDHSLLLIRRTRDLVLVPVDRAYWRQSHRVPVGPPIPSITAVSKVKVGAEPGCDFVTVAFEFDQPVVAWQVRVNGTSHLDGTLADDWTSERIGFGQQAFGRHPFGRSLPGIWTLEGQATVLAAHLLHGENDVVIYGQALDGGWSHHPVGSLTSATRG